MDSVIESFFDNFSNGIDRKRIEDRKDLDKSFQAALSVSNILKKKSGPPRKLQNPFVHARVSFPETSSTYTFLEDLVESLSTDEVQSIVDDYSFFVALQNGWGDKEFPLIIEGRAGRGGTIDLLFYFSNKSRILSFLKVNDVVDVVFLFNGLLKRMDFSKISENSFSSGDFVILTNSGVVDLDSDIVSGGNII